MMMKPIRRRLPQWSEFVRWSVEPRVWFPFAHRDYIGRLLPFGSAITSLCTRYNEVTEPGFDLTEHQYRRAWQLARGIRGRLVRLGCQVLERADGRYLIVGPDGRGRVIGWGLCHGYD